MTHTKIESKEERRKRLRREWQKNNKDKVRIIREKYLNANREKLAAKAAMYRKSNPSKVAKLAHRMNLKKTGISDCEFDRILLTQNNKCAICLNDNSLGHRLCVDHDHETNEIRGLLCHNCNRGIGLLGDSIDRLQSAIEYLGGKQNKSDVKP